MSSLSASMITSCVSSVPFLTPRVQMQFSLLKSSAAISPDLFFRFRKGVFGNWEGGSWILTFSLLTCDLSSLKNGRLSCLLLLRSSKVFFDLFRHDVRLRKACSTTLQTHSRFIGREKLCNDGRYMKVNVDFIFARYTSCFLADKVICSSGFLLMDLLERSDGFYSNIWTMVSHGFYHKSFFWC
ncbi:hypothetical protein S83_055387 [Arachis hypogaea]